MVGLVRLLAWFLAGRFVTGRGPGPAAGRRRRAPAGARGRSDSVLVTALLRTPAAADWARWLS